MDVRIFSKCNFTLVGLREIFSRVPALHVKFANRFTLIPQGRKKCIFIIDSESEGFEEYYASIKCHFYDIVSVFIIINNSNHEPVCIDEKTVLIPKSTPISYLYKVLNIEEINESGAAQPVKLSKSEHAVFRYWSEGYSPEVIAERVGINKKSVLNSKARLLNKHGVHDKNSLLLIASILFKRKIIKLGESSENAP
ncbi:LuxR family transcriptional regulator [Candidatus Symbiopectobacterium sp. 'North America']|uniref:helix-turn-helix transcriptional regulator n=1 Tax=Candidatus Symbiopectobacterium sp. 'North America' TaxID=2794574 RepID=UPI0018CB2F74|nr:LuxR C-terminal-related transcriptional regulator [Candidatus Symbiopectobacterium sp. 'North America']MBG6245921.1 LuxR family transcriptional regulator [Candidatus Symbiopectobacterium sp. 'North America']